MASPFKHFRKHQKAMLAVLGILCMIGFTVGPSTLDWISGHSASLDPVVATANGESLRQSNIQHLIQSRYLANQFVHGCMVMAYGEQMAMLQSVYRFQRSPGQFFGSTTEEDVVRTHLLAEEAERVGMLVSDEAINKYLREITDDKVPVDGYRSMANNLKVSPTEVFAALRTELAAERLAGMSLPNAQATPAQRWDYYRRMKQRASIEAVPVRVAEFVDEVSDPATDELSRFFDSHKEQEPDPLSPTPGFKVPRQAAFQYYRADYDKFYDESAITQEEIEKHYEQYKDQKYLYSAFDSPEFDQPAESKNSESEKSDSEKSDAEKTQAEKSGAEGKKPADDKSESAQPETKEADAAPDKEPEASKDESKPSQDKPAAEQPVEKKAADDKEPVGKNGSEQSSLPRLAPPLAAGVSGLLTGLTDSLLLADGETESADKPAAKEKPAQTPEAKTPEAKTPEAKTPEAKTPEAKEPAAEKPAADESEKQPTTSEDKSATDADATKKTADEGKAAVQKLPAGPPTPISDEMLLHRDIREGAKPKYAPLWRVEASIRKELAGQKAVEKMTKALDAIQVKIARYRRNLSPDEELEGEEQAAKKPSLPDFAKLAKEQQLSEHKTELLTALAFKEQHAALADATPEQVNFSESPRKFLEIAYQSLPKLQTAVVKDLAGNRYLVWKTDELEAYVPELSDVRDEVVRSWKMIQARELAQKRADVLVDEAKTSDKPLKELFSKRDVVATPPFSWLTRGAAGAMDPQARVTMSEVEGIQDAGPDFMREVFSLGVGEVGRAMNQPQTVCYVVRVVTLEPSREVLRSTFMVDAYNTYESASIEDRREVVTTWIKGIENEAHLTWKRPVNESSR